tara:strand:+ start:40 stop:741 length:702 start_codon:yes stop_codon:yes gene_type:complete
MLTNVLKVFVFLLVVYVIINLFSKPSKLLSMSKGNEQQTISGQKMKNSGNSADYTYSLWFYVDDWNYKFGQEKVLWNRVDASNQPGPSVSLGAMENDIVIKMACYPTSTATATQPNIHTCKVKNFPIQKWVNLIVSLQGETLDVYVDGKLHKTCVMEGVPKVTNGSDVVVTPDGGFSGSTSNFQYWDKASNPQEAYNIYRKGYGGGVLGNAFNKYKLRVQVLKDNDVAGGFEL